MKRISSKKNRWIKYLSRLSRRKYREREGRFVIEGARIVADAINAGWPVEALFHSEAFINERSGREILDSAVRSGIPALEVEAHLLEGLSGTETPQGLIAVVKKVEHSLRDVLGWGTGKPLILVIEGVQDPGNLGTLIRCADAAGVNGVVIFRGTVDLFNPKTLRSTAGSIFHLPVLYEKEDMDVINFFRRAGLQVVVGSPSAKKQIQEVDFTVPTLLAVGNEGRGASPVLVSRADHVVCIPMPGRAESLNVAVAAGIMLYEAIRQRIGAG